MHASVAESPIPDFSVPEPKFAGPYSPDVDFFRIWGKDDEGRNVYVGLDYAETVEFQSLKDRWIKDPTQSSDAPQKFFNSKRIENDTLFSIENMNELA